MVGNNRSSGLTKIDQTQRPAILRFISYVTVDKGRKSRAPEMLLTALFLFFLGRLAGQARLTCLLLFSPVGHELIRS